MQVQVVGMAWYKPENFERLRSIFDDGHKLHNTYSEWLFDAEKTRNSIEMQGIRVICVDIDPDEFPKWCRANGKNIDAKARVDFANIAARKVATGG